MEGEIMESAVISGAGGRLGHTESHRGANYAAAAKQKCIKINKRYCLRIHFLPRSVDD